MAYKIILAPMMFEETARTVAETALQLAGPTRGHVIGKHIRHVYEYYPPMAYGGAKPSASCSARQTAIDAAAAFAEAQKNLFDEVCQGAGARRVSFESASEEFGLTSSWSDELTHIPDGMARAARVADLSVSVLPSKVGGAIETDLVASLLMASGRPVFLAPRAGIKSLPQTYLVAWDGSCASSRAIEAALPLLQSAKEVRLITLRSVDVDTPNIEDAAAYLKLHGIDAKTNLIEKAKGPIAERILEEAAVMGTEMIVMGGYSHSRFREAILGGVTRHILNYSDRPVLMAH